MLFLIVLSFLYSSCENNDCIDLNEQENPPTLCDNKLLGLKIAQDQANNMILSLNSIDKPISFPLSMTVLQSDTQNNLNPFSRPWQFDAFDVTNQIYYFNFPYESLIFKYDLNSNSRTVWNYSGAVAAPVFEGGMLYAIEESTTTNGDFSVVNIDTSSGVVNPLASTNLAFPGGLSFEFISSTSDGNGNLYFMIRTQLLKYNIQANSIQTFDLYPGSTSTDFESFYGIEFRSNQNLIVVKQKSDPNGDFLQLVEINPASPTASQNVIFDFYANLLDFNADFHSTAYDNCDDHYYVAHRDGSEIFLYEINLNDGSFNTDQMSDAFLGLTINN